MSFLILFTFVFAVWKIINCQNVKSEIMEMHFLRRQFPATASACELQRNLTYAFLHFSSRSTRIILFFTRTFSVLKLINCECFVTNIGQRAESDNRKSSAASRPTPRRCRRRWALRYLKLKKKQTFQVKTTRCETKSCLSSQNLCFVLGQTRQPPRASQDTDRTDTPPRLTLGEQPDDSQSGDGEASREDAYPKSEEPIPYLV